MATWTVDPTNSALVISNDGRIAPRDALDPTDVVVEQPKPAAPAPEPLGVSAVGGVGAPLESVAQPISDPATSLTPRAQSVLTKRDRVLGTLDAARSQQRGGLQVVQQTTTTQPGIAPGILNPILDSNTAVTNDLATRIEQQGAEKSKRAEQSAMNDSAQAYGRYMTAEQERQDSHQRAEIARQNELAFSMQKDPEVDPDRYVKNMSTGQHISTIILAALNGAFKGLGGRPGENDVIAMLDKRIDQDIAAQKEQIQSGRIRRGNLIAYFQNQGLREEAAEKAARATSWAMLDKMTESERARVSAPEAKEQADLVAAQLRAKTQQENNQLTLTLGTPRSSTTTTRQAAPAGGDGTERIKKALELDSLLEQQGYTREQRAAALGAMGLTAPEGQTAAELKGQGSKELNEAQGKAQAASEAINELGKAAGLKRDPTTGKWSGGSDIYREGSFWDTDGQFKSRFDAAVEAYGRMQSGGVIGGEEREAFEDMLSARRANVLANKLNAAEVTIRSRQQSAAREAGPGQAAPGSWK